MQVADLFIRFVGDDKQVRKSLEELDAPAEKAGKKAGGAFASSVKKGAAAAGAVGGVVFTTAMQGAVAFEDQLATINTVARATPEELAGIGKSILDLSKETGKNTDDLTAGFYDLVSAGVPAGEAIGVLRDSAKFATGALGTTAEGVDLVTSAMNAYGLGAESSSRITDIFAKAVADGKVTAAELGASVANIAPIAASAGISLEEVSAGYALLTAKGVPAAQASTQMRAAISALLTPNEQLNKLQNKTGKNFANIAKNKGLSVALEEMRKGFAKNGDALAQLAGVSSKDYPKALERLQKKLGLTNSQVEKFTKIAGKDGAVAATNAMVAEIGEGDSGFAKALGSVEAYGFALATTGDNADDMQAQIKETGEATGLAAEQYDIASDTAKAAGNRWAASINAAFIDLGTPLLDSFGPAIQMLDQLGPVTGGVLTKVLGGAIGAAGGAVLGTVATVGQKIMSTMFAKSSGEAAGSGLAKLLTPVFTGLSALMAPVLTTVGSALGGIMAVAIPIGMALLPVLLVGAIIAAIVFLANNPELVQQILDFANGIVTFIIEGVSTLVDMLPGVFLAAFDAIMAAIPVVLGAIVNLVLQLPGMLMQLLPGLVGLWAKIWGAIFQLVAAIVGRVVGFILSIPSKAAPLIAQLGQVAARALAAFVRFVVTGVGKVVQLVLGIPGKLGELVGAFGRIASDAVQAFMRFIGELPGKVMDALAGIGDFVGGLIPHFAVGALNIPHDMLAVVHKGEMIIPANEAEAVRQGRSHVAAQPGGPVKPGGAGVTVNVYNPTPEPASTSTKRELQKVALFGGANA